MSMCIGTAFIEEADIETAKDIFRELLRGAVEQSIFGEEQSGKLLTSVQTVYFLRNSDQKEMDAGIKFVADNITSHPEQKLPIETLAVDIFVSKYCLNKEIQKQYRNDSASVLYPEPHTEITETARCGKDD